MNKKVYVLMVYAGEFYNRNIRIKGIYEDYLDACDKKVEWERLDEEFRDEVEYEGVECTYEIEEYYLNKTIYE